MSKTTNPLDFKQSFFHAIPEGYVDAEALTFADPKLVFFNDTFANQLNTGLPTTDEELALLFSGQVLPDDAKPIAQAYAGHQFGNFNPQLGDGRAMILGELTDSHGDVHELDLKGSGPTAFSRGGDGKAALGPMLREVLVSEAMFALGVPTTRSLAVVSTGEQVYRSPPQPGAVLARTANSHIRIGTFQFFAARRQTDVVKKLVDFSIARHYPHLQNADNPALALLNAVIEAQANLIAQWMGFGFVHGVMNTDNMLVGGETIDYGPCAFMDHYDPQTVFSSIDQRSRYAYFNQPGVALWNLSRFAETLLLQIDEDHDKSVILATEAVQTFSDKYESAFRSVMCDKLGLVNNQHIEQLDALIDDWLAMLKDQSIDWTLAHYWLAQHLCSGNTTLFDLFNDKPKLEGWLIQHASFATEDNARVIAANPCVIPRNHLVEEALTEAGLSNNLAPFKQLLNVLQKPFVWPEEERFTQPASQTFTDAYVTFCGT